MWLYLRHSLPYFRLSAEWRAVECCGGGRLVYTLHNHTRHSPLKALQKGRDPTYCHHLELHSYSATQRSLTTHRGLSALDAHRRTTTAIKQCRSRLYSRAEYGSHPCRGNARVVPIMGSDSHLCSNIHQKQSTRAAITTRIPAVA